MHSHSSKLVAGERECWVQLAAAQRKPTGAKQFRSCEERSGVAATDVKSEADLSDLNEVIQSIGLWWTKIRLHRSGGATAQKRALGQRG